MNKDNAKLYLPLVQALADGKTLEFRFNEREPWMEMTAYGVSFTYEAKCYRIKPEPRKLYGVFNRYGDLIRSYVSMSDAISAVNRLEPCGRLGPYTVVTFVEENQNV